MKCTSQGGRSVKFEEGLPPYAQALFSPLQVMIDLLTGLQTKKPRQTSWLGLLDLATLSFVYSHLM